MGEDQSVERLIESAVAAGATGDYLEATAVAERVIRERISGLQAVTVALSEARLPQDVANVVATEMLHVLGADQAIIAVASRDAPDLFVLGHTGLMAGISEAFTRFPADAHLPAARAFQTQRPVWLSSREQYVAEYPLGPRADLRTQAIVCLPMTIQGVKLGVIAFGYFRPREFDVAERTLIHELAGRAAFALDRARLYEEEKLARSRAEQIYRFAQAVMVSERVEHVFDAALDAIERAFGTSRASILVFDDDGVMRFKAWRGLSDAYRNAVEGHSPWGPDAIAPVPILVPDVEHDPEMSAYLPVFRKEGIAALGFIPLVTGGRLRGKFMVYFDRPHQVSAHELEVVQAIANHLASVIVRFAVIAKLQETIQDNEMFAGVLAHDLRNPLSAIMSAAHVLLRRQEGDGDRITKPVNRILTSGERMTRMIDQLLDFTRVRVGRGVQIHPRPTTLADLCRHAVEELELIHPEWRVTQETRGDVNGVWDSEAMLQVVSNLISNAGQHGTRSAPIRLTIDGTSAGSVTLAVHNAGSIPEALLPGLFDPFHRAAPPRTRSSGLGLGLFIVREIVRAHGGSVDVASSPVEGTTFTIQLPRHAPAMGMARSSESPQR